MRLCALVSMLVSMVQQHQCPANKKTNAGPPKTATFGAWSGGGDTAKNMAMQKSNGRDMVMWQTLPNPTINLPFKDGLFLYIPYYTIHLILCGDGVLLSWQHEYSPISDEPNIWFVIIYPTSTINMAILCNFGVSILKQRRSEKHIRFVHLAPKIRAPGLQEIAEPLEIWKCLGESLTLELQNLGQRWWRWVEKRCGGFFDVFWRATFLALFLNGNRLSMHPKLPDWNFERIIENPKKSNKNVNVEIKRTIIYNILETHSYFFWGGCYMMPVWPVFVWPLPPEVLRFAFAAARADGWGPQHMPWWAWVQRQCAVNERASLAFTLEERWQAFRLGPVACRLRH